MSAAGRSLSSEHTFSSLLLSHVFIQGVQCFSNCLCANILISVDPYFGKIH